MDRFVSSNNNIGLYGGTFDPVHNVHIELAYIALKHAKLDRIIFVPAGLPPHKKGNVYASADDRYNMLILATKHEPKFSVSRIEIDRKGPSFTIETVDTLKKLFNGSKIYLIVGMDTLLDIPNWYKADELINTVDTFLAAKRPKYENVKIIPKILNKTIWLPFEPKDIASHQIRLYIKQNKDIHDLVPNEVEKYINEHRLYRDK